MLKRIRTSLRSDLWIVLLDIIVVNGAYLLALLTRFYIHFRFTSGVGDFREYYLAFTPYYTMACILVFFICGLYGGMWRYAGLDDMNRIILANVITAVIQVAGSRLFVGRMPTSYYLIGAFLQFLLIAAIRFAYRFLHARKQRDEKQRAWTIPAIVIGSGETGVQFSRYLQLNSPFQVAVIAGNEHTGKSLDGIPIVDISSLPLQIRNFGIHTVFIADDEMSEERRSEIRRAAEDAGATVRDYRHYLSDLPGCLPLNALIGVADGPVKVVVDGAEKEYGSLQECMTVLGDQFMVRKITGTKVELSRVE